LVLTASIDWTIKLWNIKNLCSPIFEFLSPACDYQCDVQWNPVHPTVFASITSSGNLCLWNLCQSLTAPVDMIDLTREVESSGIIENSSKIVISSSKINSNSIVALNKVVWSKDGLSLLIADSLGKIHRVKVGNQILFALGEENFFESLQLSSNSSVNNVTESESKDSGNFDGDHS